MIIFAPQPVPLFTKIEESTAQTLKERFAGKQFATEEVTMNSAALQELDKQACKISSCVVVIMCDDKFQWNPSICMDSLTPCTNQDIFL